MGLLVLILVHGLMYYTIETILSHHNDSKKWRRKLIGKSESEAKELLKHANQKYWIAKFNGLEKIKPVHYGNRLGLEVNDSKVTDVK